MRPPPIIAIAALALLAACGQKGALVRPGARATSPVVIRSPLPDAPGPAAPTPNQKPADPQDPPAPRP